MALLANSAMLSLAIKASKKATRQAAEKIEEIAVHRHAKSRLSKASLAAIQSLENPASVQLLIVNKRINCGKMPNKRYCIDLFGLVKLFSHRRYAALLR